MFFVCIHDMLLYAMPEILLLTDNDLPVPVEESLIFEFQEQFNCSNTSLSETINLVMSC